MLYYARLNIISTWVFRMYFQKALVIILEFNLLIVKFVPLFNNYIIVLSSFIRWASKSVASLHICFAKCK